MDAKQVGKNISDFRKKSGMTQKELAQKLNVIDKTISRWECGYGLPDVSMLIPIANIFGVPVEAIIGDYVAEKAPTPQSKGKKLRTALLVSLSCVVLLGVVLGVVLGSKTAKLTSNSWDVPLSSGANYVFVTAFGNDEVMSLELVGDGKKGKFTCQETWQETTNGKILNCAVFGAYTIDKDNVYFVANEIADPDETAKLRTCKIVGIERYEAVVEREADDIKNVVFSDTKKNDVSSVFGRWTKYKKYFSRIEGEVVFERVFDKNYTEKQYDRMPELALADLNYVVFKITLAKTVFFIGDTFAVKNVTATFGTVYDYKTVTDSCEVNLKDKTLAENDSELIVIYTAEDGKVYTRRATLSLFKPSWEFAVESDAKDVLFSSYSFSGIVCFGCMELNFDGSFVYHETYGKNAFVSTAELRGRYQAIGSEVSFLLDSFVSNKTSTRFVLSEETATFDGTNYKATATFAENGKITSLSFATNNTDKRFFGVVADTDLIDDTLSSFNGEVAFVAVENGVIPNSVLTTLNKYIAKFM